MTEGFIERGKTVHGCARSQGDVARLRERFGAPHSFEVVDVADDRQAQQWARRVLKHDEPIELLLNNAAIVNRNAVLWEVPAEEFSQVIDVNIKGVTNVIRHFVPSMIKRRQGVIVNFSSGWGRSTSPEVAPYCATKWAVEGLTKALAQELPKGLAAVPLNPGVINTDMLQSCFGDAAESYPDPQQWAAKAVPFLLKLGPKDNGRSLSVE
jgi:NAD(P)-dependent dehydrogenase (short-subunit alcohol dehydrogenase family)